MSYNNKVLLKTFEQQKIMEEAGRILSEILITLKGMVVPGLDLWDLEKAFMNLCSHNNVKPACLNYNPMGDNPFPTGLCVSINSQAVHCFPKKGRTVNKNDIVSVDTVIKHKELHVDAAFCIALDQKSARAKYAKTAEFAVEQAVKVIKPGAYIGDISFAIESVAKENGMNVLRDYAGHGIGEEMHEPPDIPCYGKKGTGIKLIEGMALCVEALLCTKNPSVHHKTLWETEMTDGGDFVMYEDTVLVTKNGYKVLTLR